MRLQLDCMSRIPRVVNVILFLINVIETEIGVRYAPPLTLLLPEPL